MTVIGYILLGLIAGALAASLGIGGGLVFVPGLIVLFDFDQHIAQGTSLAVILPTAIIGAFVHTRARRVEWRTVIPLAVGGVAGSIIGALVALALEPEDLRKLFGVLLIVVAARMLITESRRTLQARTERATEPG